MSEQGQSLKTMLRARSWSISWCVKCTGICNEKQIYNIDHEQWYRNPQGHYPQNTDSVFLNSEVEFKKNAVNRKESWWVCINKGRIIKRI